MVYLISIEGNIGSGKSTFVNLLKNKYKNNNEIYFLDEPVEIWKTIKDENNIDILTKFYNDTKKYAFSFQMMAYITRISLLRQEIKKNPNRIFITERSIYTDREVFAKMLFDDNMIESINYQIYNKWFNEFSEIPEKNIKIFFVKTNPLICLNRIIKRNRPGEDINLDYLKNCNEYHENWLKNKNKVVLNGNLDRTKEDYQEWLSIFDNSINKLLNNNKINKLFIFLMCLIFLFFILVNVLIILVFF